MSKPAYVSVEFWRKDRDDTVTIEGWATNENTEYLFVSPSIDYDPEAIKFAVPNDKVISITPAQSIREYAEAASIGDNNRIVVTDGKGGLREIDLNASRGKGKRPILEMFRDAGMITEKEFHDAVPDDCACNRDRDNTLVEGEG